MSVFRWVISIWAILSCLVWSATLIKANRNLSSVELLKNLQPQQPLELPPLSVIIPACNEGDTLELALTTLLAQDYPGLEIILVDDRSTDNTGKVVDQMAALDERILPVHITHLPDGWLGKVHALHVATQKARGDWLLFTDADVHFQPGVLRSSVAWCIEQQVDHLTVAPEIYNQSFWLDITVAAFGLFFFTSLKADQVNQPESNGFTGIGAFNLVRKSMFDQSEGFSWLRMEVADDLGLGLMLHLNGARSYLASGIDAVGLTWYTSFGAMMRGLEKNMFGVIAHYRYDKIVVSIISIWLLLFGWLVALFSFQIPWLVGFGITTYFCLVLYLLAVQRKLKRWQPEILLIPIGQLLFSVILLRATIRVKQLHGINWRDTFYSLESLRAGQRVKL